MRGFCPICQRQLDENINEHHWIPKTFGGKETATLHKICHSKIHHTFSERELLKYYHTPERILENVEMAKFVKWISKKPVNFVSKNKNSKRKRK